MSEVLPPSRPATRDDSRRSRRTTSERPSRGRSQPPPGSPSANTGLNDVTKQGITVCVRLRPLSQRELKRGDIPVWTVDDQKNICISHKGCEVPRYAFDTVYPEGGTNYDVYQQTGAAVIQSVIKGFNGTIFAYGVTSSGKTHTMLGHATQPGLVPQAIQHIFKIIEQTPDRAFLLRLSMLEIYNEVINDLLEPSNSNLRLREDARGGGFYVEHLKEVEVLSANHALSLVAAGDAQRKVSATSFNDDSSRSHTLCRIMIESCKSGDKGIERLYSAINLIDLAGSESARAASTRNHRMEGSYINKSLLTLGTVISKLSEGNAAHIPFRDSKLTRLLQASLSGTGARVAIVCCITPAAAQAEETHNTLKFATRAKSVKIAASRNEIVDEKSMIVRYQKEIMILRKKLEQVMATKQKAAEPEVPPQDPTLVQEMQEKMHILREKLEEERQVVLNRESEKAALEARISRLTRIVLNSTRALLHTPPPNRNPLHSGSNTPLLSRDSPVPGLSSQGPQSSPRHAHDDLTDDLTSQHSVRSSLHYGQLRSVGEIHPGAALSLYDFDSPYIAENDMLREHLRMLTDEMEARGIKIAAQPPPPGSAAGDLLSRETMSAFGSRDPSYHDAGPRRSEPFCAPTSIGKSSAANLSTAADARHVLALQGGLQQLKGGALQAADFAAAAATAVAAGGSAALPTELLQRLEQMEAHVQSMLEQLEAKDKQLARERRMLERFKELEQQVELQLRTVTQENQRLRKDLSRSEQQANRMQGYGLDGMSADDLSTLIGLLTQAVERVRITVQLRQLTTLSGRARKGTNGADAAGGPSAPAGEGEADTSSDAAQDLLQGFNSCDSDISALQRPASLGVPLPMAVTMRAPSSKIPDLTASRVEKGRGGKPGPGALAMLPSPGAYVAASPRGRPSDAYRRLDQPFDVTVKVDRRRAPSLDMHRSLSATINENVIALPGHDAVGN